ncbi:MAG: protein-methionine-sulfoxide reductase heme-binding subunit MsrQ [Aeromonas sp.]|uniref:protein-methionine-sulfoxide reductase heme-binding subunit MsrQ n=1 Tax=Aeromonas sp. TaxID=647 RepID=UPI002FC7FD50
MTLRLTTRHIGMLHALVHLGSFGFLLWLGYAVPAGLLGGDPVQGLTHYLGKGALHLLLLTLLVSPLAKRWRQGPLIKLRRPLGLWCAAWASLHFMVWLGLDLQFDWHLIGGELVKRNYIVVGAIALLLLLALSITSIPALLRTMGPSWQRLHNWIYAVALLAPIHYCWSVKSGWQEPLIYLLVACTLLVPRRDKLLRPWKQWQQKRQRLKEGSLPLTSVDRT